MPGLAAGTETKKKELETPVGAGASMGLEATVDAATSLETKAFPKLDGPVAAREPERRAGDNAIILSSWEHLPAVVSELAQNGHVRITIPPLPEGATDEMKAVRNELKDLLKTIKELEKSPEKILANLESEVVGRIKEGDKLWEQVSGSFEDKKIRAFVPLSKGNETEPDKIEERMLKKLHNIVEKDVEAGRTPRVMLDEGVEPSANVLRHLVALKSDERADIRELKSDGTIRKVGLEELRDRLMKVGTDEDRADIEKERAADNKLKEEEARENARKQEAAKKEQVQRDKEEFTKTTENLESRVQTHRWEKETLGHDSEIKIEIDSRKAVSYEGLVELEKAYRSDLTGQVLKVTNERGEHIDLSDVRKMIEEHPDRPRGIVETMARWGARIRQFFRGSKPEEAARSPETD